MIDHTIAEPLPDDTNGFCGSRAASAETSLLAHRHTPFFLFAAGSFLFSIGAGFHGDIGVSLFTFGAALSVSSLFLPQTHELLGGKPQGSKRSDSASPVFRPDLPSCSSCGEIPLLHKTASGRFRVQCSDSRCWKGSRIRFVHLTEQEAAAAWTEAQK